jgi:hypothetical protein
VAICFILWQFGIHMYVVIICFIIPILVYCINKNLATLATLCKSFLKIHSKKLQELAHIVSLRYIVANLKSEFFRMIKKHLLFYSTCYTIFNIKYQYTYICKDSLSVFASSSGHRACNAQQHFWLSKTRAFWCGMA